LESEVTPGEFSEAGVPFESATGVSIAFVVSGAAVTVGLILAEADCEALATTRVASLPWRFAITATNTIKPEIPNAIRAKMMASPTITQTPDGVLFFG